MKLYTDGDSYTNFVSSDEYISLLKYFDALSASYYDDLFSKVIPDNAAFSTVEIQTMLHDVLSSGVGFNVLNRTNEGFKNPEISEFNNKNVNLKYIMSSNSVKMIEITVESNSFKRELQ
jgi:hypothetical protein